MGRLVRSDEQAWCRDLPEKSHRIMYAWRMQRYQWLDRGIPQQPNFQELRQAKSLDDMEEAEYCAEEEVRVTVGEMEFQQEHVDVGEVEVEDEGFLKAMKEMAFLQTPPRKRRSQYSLVRLSTPSYCFVFLSVPCCSLSIIRSY